MPISLVLDIIISVLLILTIAYAVRLNQRLSQLRSDKNELLQLAKTFAEATVRAEASIQQLKISSDALQNDIKRADGLKEDLSYLVERGGRSADEMVASVRSVGRAPERDARQERGQERRPSQGASRSVDPEARLIEEAIRAATPQGGAGQGAGRGADQERDQRRSPPREDAGAVTRRISGRSSVASTPGVLASRGLGALDGGEDEDAIEDTQAARDLLKALSSVK